MILLAPHYFHEVSRYFASISPIRDDASSSFLRHYAIAAIRQMPLIFFSYFRRRHFFAIDRCAGDAASRYRREQYGSSASDFHAADAIVFLYARAAQDAYAMQQRHLCHYALLFITYVTARN